MQTPFRNVSTISMAANMQDWANGALQHLAWIRWWKTGDVPWQKDEVDPFLLKHGTSLFGGKKRIFVPLCGKSPDVLWLYEQGHKVVGVEIAEQPVKELFQENSIDHIIDDVQDSVKVYKSKDIQLTVFAANIFDINATQYGKFDVIWDSQSFTAINLEDHERYRNLIYAVMEPNCVGFLKTLEYDSTVWSGPPHSTDDNVVRKTFGDKCNIELLEEASPPGNGQDHSLKDNQSASTRDDKGKMDKLSAETESALTLSEENNLGKPSLLNHKGDFNNPLSFVKKSSYIFDRWYKLTLK